MSAMEATPEVLLPAFAEPTQVVTRGWISRFGLIWFGYWMASLVPVNLLLPNQLAAIDPVHKVRDLGYVNGLAGVAALVALPLCGALCDRSRSPIGRRRIWMLGGTACYAVALVGTGQVHSWIGVAVLWSLTMAGLSAATAGLTAAMADTVPDQQRGVVSGALYGPQALGVVVGIGVINAVALSISLSYVLLAAVLILSSYSFISRYQEAGPAATEALSLRAIAESLWISPRDNPDFAWAFGGRLLVNLGNSLGTAYLLYFLTDDLKVSNPDGWLLILTIVYLMFTLTSTIICGILSDRLRRRRVFVFGAATAQALGGLGLAVFPSLTFAVIGAALLGAGYGAYMAVDQALITEVLPDAGSRAKDLGIMNIGSVVPQAAGPLGASLIISSLGGYPTLFGTAAATGMVGAVLVYKIKSVD
jgi:MFS family permease